MRRARKLRLVRWPALATALALAVWAAWPRGGDPTAEARLRQSRPAVQTSGAPASTADAPGLVLGEFRLARKAVLDGDPLRVVGLPKTLRLLGIDTEETFKDEDDRREATRDFQAYVRAKRGESPRPVKMGTPMGEEAKRFAEAFFRDVESVRLERDHPEEVRGYFGRFLTYVFAMKDGQWVNYNIEAVRAGMSPYFTKYGCSRRFHEEFVQAQEEARAARRGIWDPGTQHYPDYDERLAWWNARGDFLREMEREAEGRDDFVFLTRWNAMERLRGLVGREAVVVGAVSRVARKDRVALALLARRKNEDFPVVFFDFDVLEKSGIERHEGEYVRVRGRVRLYKDPRRSGKETVEMVIERPDQVRGAAPRAAAGDTVPDQPTRSRQHDGTP